MLSTLILLSTLISVPAFASVSGSSYGNAFKTEDSSVILDGKKDDAYIGSVFVPINFIQAGSSETDSVTTAYFLWSDNYLYCYVYTSDDEQFDADINSPIYTRESIELFIDADNGGESVAYYAIDIDGNPYYLDYTGIGEQNGKDAVNTFEYSAYREEEGWGVEFKVPMSDLKLGRKIGVALGFHDFMMFSLSAFVLSESSLDAGNWDVKNYDYIVLAGENPNPGVPLDGDPAFTETENTQITETEGTAETKSPETEPPATKPADSESSTEPVNSTVSGDTEITPETDEPSRREISAPVIIGAVTAAVVIAAVLTAIFVMKAKNKNGENK